MPDESHFFVAVCAHRPQIGNPTFLYVPRVANVLRERERHIAKLEGELATKDQWLDKAHRDEHQKLLVMFREQKEELERSNRWAEELNAPARRPAARALTNFRRNWRAIRKTRARWWLPTTPRLPPWSRRAARKRNGPSIPKRDSPPKLAKVAEALTEAAASLEQTEKDLQERTVWALRLEEEKRQLEDQLNMVRASRWIKLGRKVGLGPAL